MGFVDRALGKGELGPDLQLWGHDRGLEFVHEADRIEGIALELGGERHSNFCIGKLDGEQMGVVFHESYSETTSSGGDQGQRWFEFTRVAVRVPEALVPLQAFVVTNGPREDLMASWLAPTGLLGGGNEGFGKLAPEALGLGTRERSLETRARTGGIGGLLGFTPMWRVTVRMQADTGMLTRLMQGPVGDALEAYPGGCGLDYGYGTLKFTHEGELLGPGPELDAAVDLACLAGRELQALVLEQAQPQPFETALPEPEWVNEPPSEPAQAPKTKKWGPFKVVQATAQTATMKERFDPFARGAAYEDPAAYHAAFPSNPAPGAAEVVWRKERDGRTLRMALHGEGKTHTGPCVVLLPVNAEDRPGPITTEPGTMGVAVKDGVMAAWMYRDHTNFSPELMDLVENQAFEVASHQGWLS
jgi:hypothetical protein